MVVVRVTRVRFPPFALEKMVVRILFICKYNAFRSKVAENYFRKINKNKSVRVASAGFIDGGGADQTQRAVAKRLLGVDISGKMRHLSLKLIREQDLVVVVAKDVPRVMFNHSEGYGKTKFIYWGVKDEQLQNRRNVEKIVRKIKKRVEKLVKKLE